MPRNPSKRRCGAHSRRTGEPCTQWAMRGQTRCRMHGGASPQARRAAQERVQRGQILRAVQRAERRQHELLLDWWTERICYAAQVLDRDPSELVREVHERGRVVGMLGRWPVGLRAEDEPVVELDGRCGPRSKLRGA